MALLLTLSLEARAQDFELDLGQAREIIAGKEVARTAIPDGAKELTVYPLAVERPRDLLSELPGQPMRQVDADAAGARLVEIPLLRNPGAAPRPA